MSSFEFDRRNEEFNNFPQRDIIAHSGGQFCRDLVNEERRYIVNITRSSDVDFGMLSLENQLNFQEI